MNPAGARRIAQELQLLHTLELRSVAFHGHSMEPFLREGDRLVVERVAWEQIRPGDVVTYRYLDRYPTRRVVRRTAWHLDLWCDGWSKLRYRAARRDVLGRVVARDRDGEWLRRHDDAWQDAARNALDRHRGSRAARRARRERWGWLSILPGVRKPRPPIVG